MLKKKWKLKYLVENITCVIVSYDGEQFPGRVIKINKRYVEVNCLVRAGVPIGNGMKK